MQKSEKEVVAELVKEVQTIGETLTVGQLKFLICRANLPTEPLALKKPL